MIKPVQKLIDKNPKFYASALIIVFFCVGIKFGWVFGSELFNK